MGPEPGGVLFGQIVEALGVLGEVADEASVEVGEAEECLELASRGWGLPVGDSFYLFGVHLDAAGGDDEPQVFGSCHAELALGEINLEAGFCQALEHFSHVGGVLLDVAGVDENVVKVGGGVVVQDIVEHVVDISLECRWGTAKAEGCDEGFVQAEPCDERGLPLMALSDPHAIERCDYVELDVDLGVADGVERFSDQGEGVSVLDGDVVHAAVVLADPHAAAGLPREK